MGLAVDRDHRGAVERRVLPNEALQLTKREYLVGRPASRAGAIESRFAAERRCSADTQLVHGGSLQNVIAGL